MRRRRPTKKKLNAERRRKIGKRQKFLLLANHSPILLQFFSNFRDFGVLLSGWPRFGSVRLRIGGGTVRAVPVLGSGGSSKEGVFVTNFVCFSTV